MGERGLPSQHEVRKPLRRKQDTVFHDLRSKIVHGMLPSGRRLPSVIELEEYYQVSERTMKRVLGSLSQEGLIRGVRGHGTYVTDLFHHDDVQERKESILESTSKDATVVYEQLSRPSIFDVISVERKPKIPKEKKSEPVLTRAQEYILFSRLRRGELSTASLLDESEFKETMEVIPESERVVWRKKWDEVAQSNPTIDNVIAEWNMGLVGIVAGKYKGIVNRRFTFDDVLSGGREGLLKAIANFEPERRVKFSSYAVLMILGSIQKAYREAMGKSAYSIRALAKARHFSEAVHAVRLREPTQTEIRNLFLALTDYSPQHIERTVLTHFNPEFFYREMISQSTNTEDEAIEHIIWEQLTPALRDALSVLDRFEREVVLNKIVGQKTVFEIARETGKTSGKIQAILDLSLRSLRGNVGLQEAYQLQSELPIDFETETPHRESGLDTITQETEIRVVALSQSKKRRQLTSRQERQRLRELAIAEDPELVKQVKEYFEEHPILRPNKYLR